MKPFLKFIWWCTVWKSTENFVKSTLSFSNLSNKNVDLTEKSYLNRCRTAMFQNVWIFFRRKYHYQFWTDIFQQFYTGSLFVCRICKVYFQRWDVFVLKCHRARSSHPDQSDNSWRVCAWECKQNKQNRTTVSKKSKVFSVSLHS